MVVIIASFVRLPSDFRLGGRVASQDFPGEKTREPRSRSPVPAQSDDHKDWAAPKTWAYRRGLRRSTPGGFRHLHGHRHLRLLVERLREVALEQVHPALANLRL